MEFLCTPHLVSLIISILYDYGTFVTIDKPILIHYYQLNAILDSVFIREEDVCASSGGFSASLVPSDLGTSVKT